jgi:RNA polymerase sigma-54 factor
LLQLERQSGRETIEYKIVRDHLEDLARKRHPQIARALGTSVERVAEAAARIGRLTPNPGGDFDPTGNPYILPDVIIPQDDDGQLGGASPASTCPTCASMISTRT